MKRIAALAAILALIVSLGLAWSVARPDAPAHSPRAEAKRPMLALLSSLPLVFGESFAIEQTGSPALAQLERRYRIAPVAVADSASLSNHRLLLMAHPLAQPAEVLVQLDAWVRGGGRLVLLADPRLEWESSLPFGDPLRPPPAFADTGLLRHWGLVLGLDGARGYLRPTDQRCAIERDALVARCRIGAGQATIIADADFIMGNADLALLIDELARVEPR